MGDSTVGRVDCLKPKELDEGDWTYDAKGGSHICLQG